MKPIRDLDSEASEYKDNAKTSFENELILNWYPQRVLNRIETGKSILELGIGHGYTPIWFEKASARHVVIDGSKVVIDQFRINHPEYGGDIAYSYFEEFDTNDTFDYIIMGFILEHVDDPQLILKRFRKFLSPKGKLYIAVPNGKSLNRRLGLAMGMIDDIYSLNQNDLALGHKRQYCMESLRRDVEVNGLRITHSEGIYLKPFPLAVLQGLESAEQNFQALMEVGIDFPELCVAILIEAELMPDR
jgi:2-polyprenyl-3-methyl-5-hydroxy-6-metoxy-1,4-benzoquinol methylase